MATKNRYTTRQQDAAFMMRAIAEANRTWAIGEACLSYNGREETTVIRIYADIATLANGESMHISKMRSVR